MRIVIIVLIVIAVSFTGMMVYGGLKSDNQSTCPATHTAKSVRKCKMPDWSSLMGKVMSPFAPTAEISPASVSLNPHDDPVGGSVSTSTKDYRMVRLHLVSGAGMRITYACVKSGNRTCPATLCVCASGADFGSGAADDCGWDSGVCPKGSEDGTLVAYPEGGGLEFKLLDSGQPAAVQSKQ